MRRPAARAAAAALLLAAALIAAPTAHAGSAALRFCDGGSVPTAAQQSRLLRFAAVVREELQRSGAAVALVGRSGTDLSRFDLRYSHGGIALREHPAGAWTVRQLYYACDEGRPRLYDQGLAGFVAGTDDASRGFVSALLLPAAEGASLAAAALDAPRANRLLAADYSANAFPFDTRYQNCNQWIAELMATAWAPLADGSRLRERAQAWLAEAGYAPPPVQVPSRWVMLAAAVVPWVHVDDHPEADRIAMRFRTSLPTSLEAFARQRSPQSRRLEICHDAQRIVVRAGDAPIDAGCVPRDGDRVVPLD